MGMTVFSQFQDDLHAKQTKITEQKAQLKKYKMEIEKYKLEAERNERASSNTLSAVTINSVTKMVHDALSQSLELEVPSTDEVESVDELSLRIKQKYANENKRTS